jgi:hypothetical protein
VLLWRTVVLAMLALLLLFEQCSDAFMIMRIYPLLSLQSLPSVVTSYCAMWLIGELHEYMISLVTEHCPMRAIQC